MPTNNKPPTIPAANPGALVSLHQPTVQKRLKELSLLDLSAELLARLAAGEVYEGDPQLLLGEQLQQTLTSVLDVHLNRFSARRYRDFLAPILPRLKPGELRQATIVDIGCGSLNPFVFSFLLLMLGARRAYTIDPTPIQDIGMAARALARAAGWFLLDPRRILNEYDIAPGEVLHNLNGFDLPLLSAGDPVGIPADRLEHRVEFIHSLSLADNEADFVFSVSLLEHLDRIDDALESLRRITRQGGRGIHVIDFADHRIYRDEIMSPFEFLKIASTDSLVYGCNRIRCDQFCDLFERHGFVVEHVDRWKPLTPLVESEQLTFVQPYRSMELDNVGLLGARLFVRRK